MLSQYISYVTRLPSKILEEITFDIYILSDSTKKVIYITSISTGITPYYVERICDKNVTITKIKRIYIWELRKFINNRDAILIDMHKLFARFFNGRDGFLVPSRVGQVLDIEEPIEKAIKLNNKNLKRMRKYNYEVFNDYDTLKFFYEKMLIPHIKKRYGDSARIDSFNDIENIFKNGELLFIKLDGECIAGELYETIGDTLFLRMQGILDENFVKDGALIAAVYFSILRAKDRNVKIVNFGGSKPFLLDGVLRHKNTWGTRICDDKTNKRIIYLKNISFKEPFIYIKDKKLEVAIFSENDKLIKEYTGSDLDFNIIERR